MQGFGAEVSGVARGGANVRELLKISGAASLARGLARARPPLTRIKIKFRARAKTLMK